MHCVLYCICRVLDNPSTSTQLLVAELTKVEERVAHCQIRLSKEQDAYEDVSESSVVFHGSILLSIWLKAPEEFLDPVTQEIMLDPVELPTSGKIMDRANIIRHLLRYT